MRRKVTKILAMEILTSKVVSLLDFGCIGRVYFKMIPQAPSASPSDLDTRKLIKREYYKDSDVNG